MSDLTIRSTNGCEEFTKRLLSRVFSQLLDCIFERLTQLTSQSTEPIKMYFSGEFDSNQTKFEKKSNNLKIGVLANNKTTGLVLLHLLRIIIDNRISLLYDSINNEDNLPEGQDRVTFDQMIEHLAACEESCLAVFDMNETPYVKLTNGVALRPVHEIDLWTQKRIQKGIVKMV